MGSEKELNCLRCQNTMERGYILDHGMGYFQSTWVQGKPELELLASSTSSQHTNQLKNIAGLTGKYKVSISKVDTYRCTKCGYLESYATMPPAVNFKD